MKELLLAFYGDDLTGSTDALEQLTLAGIHAVLFTEVPSPAQLKRFSGLQAVGVAGLTRSLAPGAMKRELTPALKKLKKFGARHVHYKVCSTFDSSPEVGNIGTVLDVAAEIFHGPFVPLLVAAPALGRHCVFGNLFAKFGIGSNGEIHRLDRHPSVSRHPITPMTEADLRLHLAKQTKRKIALFDIMQIGLPEKEACAQLKKILRGRPDIVLFDAVYREHLIRIGRLIDGYARATRPLFSIGSSGIETALAERWTRNIRATFPSSGSGTGVRQILVGSGSCSPVTGAQISWALKHGFAEVAVNTTKLIDDRNGGNEIQRVTEAAAKLLRNGRSVIVHTTRDGAGARVAAGREHSTARVLGTALGNVLRSAAAQTGTRRLCVAGGDTASFAARAMGVEALEMIAPLTPGAPLCRVLAPGSPVDGVEVVFKGGQVGAEDYFGIVKHGKNRS